jgi:hypothetical protein
MRIELKSVLRWSLGTAAVVVLCSGAVLAAEWGTIKGKFVYDGAPPEPTKLTVTKDVEVCAKHPLVDESLVVGKDGGLANVVVYIRVPTGESLEVHPDYEASAKGKVEVDNLHCRFTPHIATLRTSQTLVLKNSDSVGHNSKLDCFVNPALNILIPANGETEAKLEEGERLPVRVGCNIHPWMAGYVLVRDDPYMAVSAEDGTFTIENIPVGEHVFQLWQEKSGYLRDIDLGVAKTDAKRGRATLEVKPGVQDLGEIKVPPSLFQDK